MFESGETPPVWFMRPEISKIIVDAVVNGEEVFVP
jgi:ATP sulfurylase